MNMVASTDIKFYVHTNTNAPQLTNNFGCMIDVLDACLVNGFNLVTLDSLVVAGGVLTLHAPSRMGERLQSLIGSQRQLLRDVSHELRSPLARLRIALALAERAPAEEREQLWPRLGQECDRLEALIQEILTLARLDSEPGARQPVPLRPLLEKLIELGMEQHAKA